jgi:hypothetical protein
LKRDGRAVADERSSGASDIDVQCNIWSECLVSFGVAESTLRDAIGDFRAAKTELARDQIRDEVRGFLRRLTLGMFAIVFPGEPRPVNHDTGNGR